MAANPIYNPELKINSKPTEVGSAVVCSGRITSDTSAQLVDEVRPLFTQGAIIVLDLTDVTYMDSAGLGALVRLYVSAKSHGCQFRVQKLNARLKELFSITRLGQVLTAGRDPDEIFLP